MCFILLLVRQYEVDPKVKEWSNTLATLLLLVGSYVVGITITPQTSIWDLPGAWKPRHHLSREVWSRPLRP